MLKQRLTEEEALRAELTAKSEARLKAVEERGRQVLAQTEMCVSTTLISYSYNHAKSHIQELAHLREQLAAANKELTAANKELGELRGGGAKERDALQRALDEARAQLENCRTLINLMNIRFLRRTELHQLASLIHTSH